MIKPPSQAPFAPNPLGLVPTFPLSYFSEISIDRIDQFLKSSIHKILYIPRIEGFDPMTQQSSRQDLIICPT